MTIKSKLTLNVVVVLVIVGAVVATSVVGMGFIKNKLSYLTEQSTPYQMRTMELQRATQSAVADLIRLSAARNNEDYKKYRSEAEKSLNDVRAVQEALEKLSGGATLEVYHSLNNIGTELFETTEERLKAEYDASDANKTITQKLKDTSNKLNDLNSKIKAIQLNRSTAFTASSEDTKNISAQVRDIELLRAIVKDIQLALLELQKAKDRRALIIARGKINAAISQALLNEHLREEKTEEKTLHDDIKAIEGKVEEAAKLYLSLLSQPDDDAKNKGEDICREISGKLTDFLLHIEQEILSARENYSVETRKQGGAFEQSNIANSILISNSELVALGLYIEGLTMRLFTLASVNEVDAVASEIKKTFEKIDSLKKSLDGELGKLDVKDEIKIFRGVTESLNSVKGMLFAEDGVIEKLRHKLTMDDKALKATERLEEIVAQQAAKGKETVTAAQSEQEKAIGTVTRMVRYSTTLIGIISVAAVIFGIGFGMWVYKSISKPLTRLIQVSDDVAKGDLTSEITASSNDELGTVQTSMSKMVANLRDMVGKISAATENLASSSEELSATAVSLEKGSNEQVKLVEQSVTAITQMSQATTDVSMNTSNTAEAARQMKDTAIHGKETTTVTVKELIGFMDRFKGSVSRIESLGNKSEEITHIVSLIKGIAEQTNLLALNAAIEAARAGEVGRGFAIVADNVRELAERTTVAAADIAKNVEGMKTEIKESVSYMKSERDNVETVLNNIKNTSTAIDDIVRNVENVTDMVQRIAAAAEEQSAVSGDVNRNVEDISSVTRELDNSVTGIKSSSEYLSRLAVELNSMTGWFKT